jgi:hypothetical protein
MIGFLRTAQRATTTSYPLYTNCATTSSGGGFGISAVSKNDTVSFKIDNQIINNEP